MTSRANMHAPSPEPRVSTLWRIPTAATLKSKSFWIGDYDYAALLNPRNKEIPFFGPNEPLPVLLAVILGVQHALAMLGGLVVPPLLIGGSAGAALSADHLTYLISASLIWCGFGTFLQISRISLGKGYYLGSGILNVIGTSFGFVTVSLSFLDKEFSRGACSYAADGTKLPCPEGLGALLGTASVVAVVAIALAFTPPKILRRLYPPVVTGSTLLLMGVSLMSAAIVNWQGGSSCETSGSCLPTGSPDATYGSARMIGIGFLVWASIVVIDMFGPPLIKNMSVMLGLVVGMIVTGALGYFDTSTIHDAPAATFVWVTTFPLSVRGELVLPLLAAYLVVISEGIANITGTASMSRISVKDAKFSTHVQGGLLSDALWSCIAGLATVPPSTTFSQNVSIIALSNNASRVAGYVCGLLLLLCGIFSKIGAIFVAMPASLIGGMTTFLFSSVCVTALQILSTVHWSRRNRFIATVSLSLGFVSCVAPDWFSNFFTYEGSNTSLSGFLSALTLVVEEGYLINLLLAAPLSILLPLGEDDHISIVDGHDMTSFGPRAHDLDDAVEQIRAQDEEMALGAIDTK